MYTRSLIAAGAVALAVLGCQREPTAPTTEVPLRGESTARPIEGWFHILWVDPAPGNGPETVRYELVDGRGHGTELELAPSLTARWGGPRGLNGRKVWVSGQPVSRGGLVVQSLRPIGTKPQVA